MSNKHLSAMIKAAINSKPAEFKKALYSHLQEKKKTELDWRTFKTGQNLIKDK